ncbi:MAG: hypothetical protein IJQ67_07245 [Bacilli bacterium]|nr:hypothetical protein [Bacilli bacterium]
MTAEERVKKWIAEEVYAEKLMTFATLVRYKYPKEEIAKTEAMTLEELEELINYDEMFKMAFEGKGIVSKKQYIQETIRRAFGYYKPEHVTEKDTIDSNGKAVRIRTTKKKWYPGSDEVFFYFGKKFVDPEMDKDLEGRQFKEGNKVTCLKPTKKKK